jgi:hypothetical protein
MTLFHFLVVYSFMIVLGVAFCIGWFICTRGEWFIMPDGKYRSYGMVFKQWSLFWEQYRKEKRVYFNGDELMRKLDLLKKVRPDLSEKFRATGSLGLEYKTPHLLTKIQEEQIEDVLACKLEKTGGGAYKLFVIYPVYDFPEWIRKPLSECPTCMASAYGSVFYWFVILNGPTGFFAWARKENLAKFGFWVIFCLILACGNKFVAQKMKL